MKLLSEVILPKFPFSFSHRESSLWMGSCFTDNIGSMLDRYRFPVCINPFGTVFNPLSLKTGLKSILHKNVYLAEDLEEYQGRWFSFDHYTAFSNPDQERCLEGINSRLDEARKTFSASTILVLTWGSSWVYTLKENGRVVSNCHKLPARNFERRRLEVDEIVATYRELIPDLLGQRANLKVLLTISPVRHLKDGAHGNQLSKAVLLLAAEQLAKEFPGLVYYFPSYEIVMDELRDYRFYASDLSHTNELATQYIWEKLKNALIAKESREIIMELEPWLKLSEHRPLDSSPEALKKLEDQISDKKNKISKRYPFIKL